MIRAAKIGAAEEISKSRPNPAAHGAAEHRAARSHESDSHSDDIGQKYMKRKPYIVLHHKIHRKNAFSNLIMLYLPLTTVYKQTFKIPNP